MKCSATFRNCLVNSCWNLQYFRKPFTRRKPVDRGNVSAPRSVQDLGLPMQLGVILPFPEHRAGEALLGFQLEKVHIYTHIPPNPEIMAIFHIPYGYFPPPKNYSEGSHYCPVYS